MVRVLLTLDIQCHGGRFNSAVIPLFIEHDLPENEDPTLGRLLEQGIYRSNFVVLLVASRTV